ncbi:MAG: hypothetical protein GY952_14025 [Rhodobacteraceae bacterium]|nr:hypothetical protein [Paracoccaceae bacterium]
MPTTPQKVSIHYGSYDAICAEVGELSGIGVLKEHGAFVAYMDGNEGAFDPIQDTTLGAIKDAIDEIKKSYEVTSVCFVGNY